MQYVALRLHDIFEGDQEFRLFGLRLGVSIQGLRKYIPVSIPLEIFNTERHS